MLSSEARIVTDRPGRYLTQLCRHFAHKITTEWTDERGFADFGFGTCTLLAEDGALVLRAEGADEPGLSRVEYVVGDHLERFAARDGLTAHWSRPAPA
ncbi:DUF2218 domain-containing protein [Polymorphospora sp. NPDC050346]|uniref:DUF2218 domain-containing protein n=1 Tax=Polymorphospora sp. NPDC050346 TaxID=3155780 RepID=UPI0033D81B5F